MTATCPLCHRRTVWKGNPWRPFCSERCKLLDLGAWAAERYRVPTKEPPPESDPPAELKPDA